MFSLGHVVYYIILFVSNRKVKSQFVTEYHAMEMLSLAL